MANLLSVLLSAVKSVASAVFLFLWASCLAWRGYADQQFLGKLAKVAKVMFLPSLMFSSISSGMSVSFLEQHWALPVFGLLVLVIGFIVGIVFACALNIPAALRPWYVLAIAVPNMIALPLVLVEALCHEQESSTSHVAECISGATTRLFSVVLTHHIIFWTLGYGYVQLASAATDNASEKVQGGEQEEHDTERQADESPTNGDPSPTAVGHVCESAGAVSGLTPAGIDHLQKANEVQAPKSRCQDIMAALVEPPVVANVVGIVVACWPSLHGLFYSAGAPLSSFSSGISLVGKASPAVTNFIAGASFGLQLLSRSRDDPLGLQALGLSGKAMAILVLSRIVVVPVMCAIALQVCLEHRWILADPLSRLILFFQPGGTTANVVTVLAQLTGQRKGAQMVALSTIPQMILYVPMTTLFISYGMMQT
eukprot:TRINITY_DN29472_c0_g2_i1.p1 TRINITY_DN29472_c0_g2~~TRINITY_DN29472_c0_g2_i1.p1  ORF type:complete len:425 (+),score=60.23 TRINITY_DN29472_c0_g2_i1:48-1322(+)